MFQKQRRACENLNSLPFPYLLPFSIKKGIENLDTRSVVPDRFEDLRLESVRNIGTRVTGTRRRNERSHNPDKNNSEWLGFPALKCGKASEMIDKIRGSGILVSSST